MNLGFDPLRYSSLKGSTANEIVIGCVADSKITFLSAAVHSQSKFFVCNRPCKADPNYFIAVVIARGGAFSRSNMSPTSINNPRPKGRNKIGNLQFHSAV